LAGCINGDVFRNRHAAVSLDPDVTVEPYNAFCLLCNSGRRQEKNQHAAYK
jgi:hypothetical protein